MSDVITHTLLAVGAIWAAAAGIALVWDLGERLWWRRTPPPSDSWDCPQSCGVEHGYWCPHLAPEARCPAVNEHGQQCSLCTGHTPETTWPGFTPGHHHDPHTDTWAGGIT